MRIFKNKAFHCWAKAQELCDSALRKATEEIEQGLFDANLGSMVYKKRVPIANRGKSSGLRTIVAFKLKNKAFFIYGFAKNERENITQREEEALKKLAKIYFSYDEKEIHRAIQAGELWEVLI